MERELLKQIPDSSLEVIVVENFGDEIRWKEKNKEFSLDGVLYDVVRIEKREGKTYLFCINDKKEKQLLDNLVNAVNKDHDAKKAGNTIKPVLTDLFFTTILECPKVFSDSFTYNMVNVSIVSSFKETESPPPKA